MAANASPRQTRAYVLESRLIDFRWWFLHLHCGAGGCPPDRWWLCDTLERRWPGLTVAQVIARATCWECRRAKRPGRAETAVIRRDVPSGRGSARQEIVLVGKGAL